MKTLLATIATLFLLPSFALAANLDVVFEQEPLFSEAEILPGDGVTRSVSVQNQTETPQNIYVKAVNGVSSGDIGDALILTITEGATTHLTTSLSDFLDGTPRALTNALPGGSTANYAFAVAFDPNAGDQYQNGSITFDFCIGFQGGPNTCITDATPEVPGTPGGGGVGGDKGGETIFSFGSGGGNGGGGNGPGSGPLFIFNEKVSAVDDEVGIALITWNTNLPATSQVIYGPLLGGPYPIDMGDPNFGYPNSTIEDSALTDSHGMAITGLAPGAYAARVVSKTSPGGAPNISPQFLFALAPDGTLVFAPSGVTEPPARSSGGSSNAFGGSGGGGSDDTNEETIRQLWELLTIPEARAESLSSQAALAAFGTPEWLRENSTCITLSLVFLVISYAMWLVYANRNGEFETLRELRLTRNSFFLGGVSSAIAVAILTNLTCLLPFLIVLALFFVILHGIFWFGGTTSEDPEAVAL